MSAMIEEQETLISWMRGDEFAEVYTTDTMTMTRLDRLCEEHPETWNLIKSETVNGGELFSKTYKCPRNMISFRAVDRSGTGKGNTAALEAWREKQKAGDV